PVRVLTKILLFFLTSVFTSFSPSLRAGGGDSILIDDRESPLRCPEDVFAIFPRSPPFEAEEEATEMSENVDPYRVCPLARTPSLPSCPRNVVYTSVVYN